MAGCQRHLQIDTVRMAASQATAPASVGWDAIIEELTGTVQREKRLNVKMKSFLVLSCCEEGDEASRMRHQRDAVKKAIISRLFAASVSDRHQGAAATAHAVVEGGAGTTALEPMAIAGPFLEMGTATRIDQMNGCDVWCQSDGGGVYISELAGLAQGGGTIHSVSL